MESALNRIVNRIIKIVAFGSCLGAMVHCSSQSHPSEHVHKFHDANAYTTACIRAVKAKGFGDAMLVQVCSKARKYTVDCLTSFSPGAEQWLVAATCTAPTEYTAPCLAHSEKFIPTFNNAKSRAFLCSRAGEYTTACLDALSGGYLKKPDMDVRIAEDTCIDVTLYSPPCIRVARRYGLPPKAMGQLCANPNKHVVGCMKNLLPLTEASKIVEVCAVAKPTVKYRPREGFYRNFPNTACEMKVYDFADDATPKSLYKFKFKYGESCAEGVRGVAGEAVGCKPEQSRVREHQMGCFFNTSSLKYGVSIWSPDHMQEQSSHGGGKHMFWTWVRES